ncbi:MAG TPA: exodeoxyribonuclease III [Candidatus Limnocylindria bacterium]|nr:exodeoxyribonuclease III [Candidatus Limnocylindria bacterium]
MKFVSWNVNGFRAVLKKNFDEAFLAQGADFFCLQETKMQKGQADYDPPGYLDFWHSAQKKGYSGTAVFTRHEPMAVTMGIGGEHLDEGRVLTLEYPNFFLVNAYVPNAQPGLARLPFRLHFEGCIRGYLMALDRQKPVVYCGDLNVAHQEIDLRNPRANRGQPGFSDEEREQISLLLNSGFTDTFRFLYPDRRDAYTWWSYIGNARMNNTGWRIDYFLVSDRLRPHIREAGIQDRVYGSDHCPVTLELELPA